MKIWILRYILLIWLASSSPPLTANLQATIEYIEQLLKEGKTVAILCIDMQTSFETSFSLLTSKDQILSEQAALLEHFASRNAIHFIDIHAKNQGETLPELLQQLRRNHFYRLFVKTKWSAFESPPQSETGNASHLISVKLDDYLKSVGVTDVHITGCFDGECVLETAKDALEAGYSVSIDRDTNIPYSNIYAQLPPDVRQAISESTELQWMEIAENTQATIIPRSESKVCSP